MKASRKCFCCCSRPAAADYDRPFSAREAEKFDTEEYRLSLIRKGYGKTMALAAIEGLSEYYCDDSNYDE